MPPSDTVRLYQVTLTDINEKSEMSLILFLCSYADHPVFTTRSRRTTCICTCTFTDSCSSIKEERHISSNSYS